MKKKISVSEVIQEGISGALRSGYATKAFLEKAMSTRNKELAQALYSINSKMVQVTEELGELNKIYVDKSKKRK